MLEVEKLLVKVLKFKWSHLSAGVYCLKEKFKNDMYLKVKGGVCIFVNEDIISWSYGILTKRSAEKSETIEIVSAKQFLENGKYEFIDLRNARDTVKKKQPL